MPDTPRYVEVAVPLGVQGTFTYAVPESLRGDIRVGSRVEVPYGSRLTTGFVTAIVGEPAIASSRIKPVRSILDAEAPALLPEIVELCGRATAYYLAPLGEMLRAALPPNMAAKSKRRYRAELEHQFRPGSQGNRSFTSIQDLGEVEALDRGIRG